MSKENVGKKKVVVQLPAAAKQVSLEERYSLELESLADVAELVEADGSSSGSFLQGARDADALLTSCYQD